MLELPVCTSPPTIQGLPRPGARLLCEPGAWSGWVYRYSYAWRRGGETVGRLGAYTAREGDLGQALSCIVSAKNSTGVTEVESLATRPVAYR